LNGEEISNPYTVEQTEEEQTITFAAYTKLIEGEEDRNSDEIESEEIIIPARDVYNPDPEG
jgi:hypothetical protein